MIGRVFVSRELGNYFLHDNGYIWGASIRCNIENKERNKQPDAETIFKHI